MVIITISTTKGFLIEGKTEEGVFERLTKDIPIPIDDITDSNYGLEIPVEVPAEVDRSKKCVPVGKFVSIKQGTRIIK